jgi:hypothetical protein
MLGQQETKKFALNIKKSSYMPTIKCSIFSRNNNNGTSNYFEVLLSFFCHHSQPCAGSSSFYFFFIIVLLPSSWELYVSSSCFSHQAGNCMFQFLSYHSAKDLILAATWRAQQRSHSPFNPAQHDQWPKAPRKGGIPSEIILKCSFICQKAVSSKLQYSSILLVGLLCLSEMQFPPLCGHTRNLWLLLLPRKAFYWPYQQNVHKSITK